MEALGVMGFIFGLSAIGIVQLLRVKMTKLEADVQSLKEEMSKLRETTSRR